MNAVVIGGGVIGLSIAYELSQRDCKVILLEKNDVGQQASWAGAGMMIPANPETAIHPMEHLEALAHDLHKDWASQLKDLTGIDNCYRECGALYVARTPGEVASMIGIMSEWDERKIEYEMLDQDQLAFRFPAYAHLNQQKARVAWVPGESQINNAEHLKALLSACRKSGVQIVENCGDLELKCNDRTLSVHTPSRSSSSKERIVFATGPWTHELLGQVNVNLPMQPVRGQMVLYEVDPHTNDQIANGPIIMEGSRYLVPRTDGHLLAGSTIEEVGFDTSTTDEGTADIRKWAQGICPEANDESFKRAWAGLRPGTYDGFPYIGKIGSTANGFVATGHFKSGLHLSTSTAVVIADLIEGKSPRIDISALSPNRVIEK